MPTKRRRIGRHRQKKSLNSLTIDQRIAIIGGWSPPGSRGEPWVERNPLWSSWADFLADWKSVRDEWAAAESPSGALRDEDEAPVPLPGDTPADETFAAWLLDRYGPDGPPEMEPDRVDAFPALIPVHPVVSQFRIERHTLNNLPGRAE